MIPDRYLEALKRLLRAEAYTRSTHEAKKQGLTKPESKPSAPEGKPT